MWNTHPATAIQTRSREARSGAPRWAHVAAPTVFCPLGGDGAAHEAVSSSAATVPPSSALGPGAAPHLQRLPPHPRHGPCSGHRCLWRTGAPPPLLSHYAHGKRAMALVAGGHNGPATLKKATLRRCETIKVELPREGRGIVVGLWLVAMVIEGLRLLAPGPLARLPAGATLCVLCAADPVLCILVQGSQPGVQAWGGGGRCESVRAALVRAPCPQGPGVGPG